MCGIVGHINLHEKIEVELFEDMLSTLRHRGPDGKGLYISKDQKKALGHHRLSFIDLSEKGSQPFSNPEKNCWVTFNGEIYNYLALRVELAGKYSFVTETDTEVILAAYTVWGIEFVNRLKGMFAIGILDESKNQLHLIRDRFGIKPLYYGVNNGRLVFASELKAIMASKVFVKELNKSAIADYFVYRYVPSPKTIWQGIKKVSPANLLTFDLQDFSEKTVVYWDLHSFEKVLNEEDLVRETKKKLKNSVKQHLQSDVPLGSFLSGGYDSSALALWMKEENCLPKTFSIGFENWEKSEHHSAKIVADYLGLPNRSTIANSTSLDLLSIMPEVYDEPIADISIIPTYMVSALARKEVKAVFSGEGADEIFGGYTWQHEFFSQTYTKNWLQKLKNTLKPNDPVDFYAQSMAMGWFDSKELKKLLHPNLHASIPKDVHWFYRSSFRKDLSPFKAIQYMDLKCFMGELVLTKVDRASMANSLEVRVPFLDHELVEEIFSVNELCYIDKNQTKKILYQSIKGALPKSILERKKQGFVGPDAYYMNMDFYKKHLKDSNLVKYNIIQKGYLDQLLKEPYNWKLWKIVVLEKWFTHWVDEANH
ncbi:MAG: asparagine synthase (glutamine-hydrolyzing) [Vicingaceae bacterium]|jgi:asparagine synthase (glutamine-hydrolysing)